MLLHYRKDSETRWTAATPIPTDTTSASFDLTGLTSDTEYHVEATIEDDFDSGRVQSESFMTEPACRHRGGGEG